MAERIGIERVLQRIRGAIEDGSYYEAQQTYKTTYYRYKAKNLIKESLKILEEGACLQLQEGHITCGTELGRLLLEAYSENEKELSEETVAPLRKIVLILPKPENNERLTCTSGEVKESLRFMNDVIKWIKRSDIESEYYKEFNSFAGEYLVAWNGNEALGRITAYFARAQNWQSLLKILRSSIIASAAVQEEDLFICRCTLQLLLHMTHDRISGAIAFLATYAASESLPDTPLIHFIDLLLEALELKSENLVNLLLTKYRPVLQRDSYLEDLLESIKEKFFQRSSNSLISNILGGILQNSSS